MASHVSNAILSLTKFVFVEEEGIYRISINTIKEMEKKDGNLVFWRKSSLISYKGLAWIIFDEAQFLLVSMFLVSSMDDLISCVREGTK